MSVNNCSTCQVQCGYGKGTTNPACLNYIPKYDENSITAQLVKRLIAAERTRQDAKWGVQKHSDEWWLAILMEEVGELSKEMLENKFGPQGDSFKHGVRALQELIQVAAVAQAWLECRLKNNPSQALLEILLNKTEV